MKNPKFLEANMSSFDVHQNGQLALSWSTQQEREEKQLGLYVAFLTMASSLSILLLN